MASNVVLSDGAGNIRFQWDGTNIKLNGNTVGSNAYTSTAYLPLSGGTLTGALSGTSATFSGDVTAGDGTGSVSMVINRGAAGNSNGLRFRTAGTNNFYIGSGATGANTDLEIYNHNTATTNLRFAYSTGAATFSSSVTASKLIVDGASNGNNSQFALTRTDSSWGIFNETDLRFYQSNSNTSSPASVKMVITTSGNVGIGTTAPSALLHIDKSTNSGDFGVYPLSIVRNSLATQGDGSTSYNFAGSLIQSGNGAVQFYRQTSYAAGAWEPQGILNVASNHPMTFKTNNTERMRITSSGNVGIGTTAPSGIFEISKSNTDYLSTSAGHLILNNPSSTGQTSIYMQTNGTVRGKFRVDFNGDLAYVANGGAHTFWTGGDYSVGSERMRITSGGRLLVGQTSASAASVSGACIFGDTIMTGSYAGIFWENRSGGVTTNSNWYGWYTTSGTIYLFNGASNIASINTSSGAYTALSDINKKKDFEDSSIGLNAIMGLKPKLFRMKDQDESSSKQLGFIAQEVKDFIPQAYIETKSEKENFIGLDDRPIIAALTKAVQELKAELDTLKNK
jgi:hypothetical protein